MPTQPGGSYVRDEVARDSDVDVLVVADDGVVNTRTESVRLRDAVGSIDMPMDILVVRESRFEGLKDKMGLICCEASRTGRLVYEAQAGGAERPGVGLRSGSFGLRGRVSTWAGA